MSIFDLTGAALVAAVSAPYQAAVVRPPSDAAVRTARAVLAAHRAATPRLTFAGWDDFAPAWGFACELAIQRHGKRWYLNPDACVKARVHVAWVSCRLSLRSSVSPRDMNFPVACFWEGGRLPVGPEYAPVSRPCNSVTIWRSKRQAPAFDMALVEWSDAAD